MRVIVPDYAFGPMGHALVHADVHAAVIERVADAWMLEFIVPADRIAFVAALGKLGVRVLATGIQAGSEPVG